ncbi:MAG: hypothetical protein ACFE8L_14195 [Candidatus Hodarchaeota archaeon]
MSKVIKWKYADFFQSRREKLINLLLSEIIFLNSHVNKSKMLNEQQYLRNALNKLEYTLNLLRNFENDLSDKEFDKFVKIIYEIIREIVINIE